MGIDQLTTWSIHHESTVMVRLGLALPHLNGYSMVHFH